jgi:hypothetical protein
MYNQHRANVRNFLVGLNMQEILEYRKGAIERDDAAGAGYADEFMRDVADDFAA